MGIYGKWKFPRDQGQESRDCGESEAWEMQEAALRQLQASLAH
jgi:hypothetical protein